MTEDRIIKNVHKPNQTRAKKLIVHIKDYTGVNWNDKSEMVVDGKTLPGSSILLLVNDIMRKPNTNAVQLEGSLLWNNFIKRNFLAVSSEMLKSRES